MLVCFVLLNLVASCSGNRQAAADAIQKSIFGSRDDIIEGPVEMMVYDHRGQGGRNRGYAQSEEAAQLKKTAHTSYSFEELSHMSVKSAPRHRGVFYKPQLYENIPIVEACQAVECHLNLVVIMDSSGSVGYHDYQLELSFVKTLLEIMAVKAHDAGVKVCTGLVSYSTQVHVEVDPCCENTICRIVDQFNDRRFQYRAGSTNTNGALKAARQMLQAAASYKKVALLITDGKSNAGGSPISFATQMRDEDGIDIVALGVTSNVNTAELKGISGMEFVTKIDVFDEFHELATILLEANYLGSEYELQTTFEGMCDADNSRFQQECERADPPPPTEEGEEEEEEGEEEEETCTWGAWSNCVKKKNNVCIQKRTCKLNGSVVDTEKLQCDCPDSSANFMAAMRLKPKKGRKGRHGFRPAAIRH